MPISFDWQCIQIQLLPIRTIAIDPSIFTVEESDRFQKMRANSRKREFYGTRLLLKEYLHDHSIGYSTYGKPFLIPEGKGFSISHSAEYAAIVFSTKFKNIAVDIESISERVLKVSHKFIGDQESKYLSEENRLTFATILWSAKEVMYKLVENGSLDFIEHYYIDQFDIQTTGKITGHYCYQGEIKVFPMKYWQMDGTIVVVGYEFEEILH